MRLANYRFTLLLLALLFLVLAPLVVGSGSERSLVAGVTMLAVFFFAVIPVVRQRRAFYLVVVLGLLAAIAQVTSLIFGPGHYPQLKIAIFIFFFAMIATLIVVGVLRARSVGWDEIQGAVCAYLLFGVAWGLLYAWISYVDPEAFRGAIDSGAGYVGEPMIYFSFVTLTTLGYGDVTPVSDAARTFAWLEAGFGQIYLVVLVARLVSLHLVHADDRGKS